MARDFANKPREPERSRIPRWVWGFTSIVAVGFVGFLYFLSQVPEDQGGADAVREQLTTALSEQAKKETTPAPQTPKHETIEEIKEKAEALKQAFEFYELLENDEVSIDLPGDSTTEPSSSSQKSTTTTSPAPAKQWIIQVASFRNVADADHVRAELILNGLPSAAIQSIEVEGKGTYHRVVVGPFTHRPTLNKAQDVLANLNYQVLVKTL